MTTLRIGSLLDVPASAVIRAFGEADTFRRAARAAGGRARILRDGQPLRAATAAAVGEILRDGDVIELSGPARFESGRFPAGQRRSAWTVTIDADRVPILRAEHGGILSIELHLTGAGTLTEIDVALPGGRFRAAAVRAKVLRFGELLISIALLVARQTPIVVAAAVVRGELGGREVLAAQRGPGREGAGRWELPGGKVEVGESEPRALSRELREELAIEVTVEHRLAVEIADLPGGAVLRTYRCATNDVPSLTEHTAVRWVAADQLDTLDWLETDRALIEPLRVLLLG